MRKITVYDTTLRDGEQAPGFSMSPATKVELAKRLAQMGVDIIEAGFPAASDEMFAIVKRIARLGLSSRISALSRAREEDINCTARALHGSKKSRIHIIIPASDILIEKQFKSNRDKTIYQAAVSVENARRYSADVQLSLMDATRADPEFIVSLAQTGVHAGACVINIADSVGVGVPETIAHLIQIIQPELPSGCITSVHCHNDFGLALANTIRAAQSGAGQIECTLGGIGERCGNAALEECVMLLVQKEEYYKMQTSVKTELLYPAVEWMFRKLRKDIPFNKPVAGKNAFRHESGIHQHALLKDRSTYEPYPPEIAGRRDSDIVIGAHSGSSGLRHKIMNLAPTLDLSENDYIRILQIIKQRSVDGKELYDKELMDIVHFVLVQRR